MPQGNKPYVQFVRKTHVRLEPIFRGLKFRCKFKSKEGHEFVYFQYASLRYALQRPAPYLASPSQPSQKNGYIVGWSPLLPKLFVSDTMAENAINHNLPLSFSMAALSSCLKMPVSAYT